ncbi:hypothetical protein CTI14_44345, partial [Methylobacterium radiotolerans]
VPVPVRVDKLKGTKLKSETIQFDKDELIRRDANLADMAKVRPAFRQGGSVTAANSSPFSDGAAAVLLMSADKAEELGVKPLAKFLGFAVAGVAPEVMGIGPVPVPVRVDKLKGTKLKSETIQFDKDELIRRDAN